MRYGKSYFPRIDSPGEACPPAANAAEPQQHLESQLTVRAEANQAQRVIVRLLVDQHQIRPDVTVAKATPLAR